ncbi:hypothetical protein [Siccirubricoccus sp. G192]|uniref:hypothetical protein n=1 Tax=Siccirubricoccus sp. G192 TaxID=2849651 RepID=UPI001C2C3352|nr:hypothetical protein [Siccirubricoccus sp. G192]MBV1798613.1 hypothetical protein [Siccirubricoccus sp. G192]
MAAAAWTGPAALAAATWDHAHGDAANSGFAGVATRPALRASATVPGLGSFAPGAGPVIGPDGTVYLGNEQGVLWALHADGSFYWKQQLGAGQSIQASPVVDTDGSIYVVGEYTYTDHRVTPAVRRTDSTLYHIAPTGGGLWTRPFPEHFTGVPQAASRGATSAPPNIWRSGSQAAIIVPAAYKVLGGSMELYLLAFPPDGGPPREQAVSYQAQALNADDGGILSTAGCIITLCFLHPGFQPTVTPPAPSDSLPAHYTAPMSGVGIFTFPGGGLPWVIVNDPWQQTIGYTFSPAGGFTEMFRKTDPARGYAASPMLLPDGHSVTAASDADANSIIPGHLVFTGPNGASLPNVGTSFPLLDTPARTSDQRLVVTSQSGAVIFLQGTTVVASAQLPGQTIASPAVSRSHVFVSTVSSLRTFNALTMTEVGRLDWAGGGLSGPAIGPSGRVYALASNTLYVFPAPPLRPCPTCTIQRPPRPAARESAGAR